MSSDEIKGELERARQLLKLSEEQLRSIRSQYRMAIARLGLQGVAIVAALWWLWSLWARLVAAVSP